MRKMSRKQYEKAQAALDAERAARRAEAEAQAAAEQAAFVAELEARDRKAEQDLAAEVSSLYRQAADLRDAGKVGSEEWQAAAYAYVGKLESLLSLYPSRIAAELDERIQYDLMTGERFTHGGRPIAADAERRELIDIIAEHAFLNVQ